MVQFQVDVYDVGKAHVDDEIGDPDATPSEDLAAARKVDIIKKTTFMHTVRFRTTFSFESLTFCSIFNGQGIFKPRGHTS